MVNLKDLQGKASEVSELLKTLAHPMRLMIVCTLIDGEYSVSELEEKLDIHQPNLSQQLFTASFEEEGVKVVRCHAHCELVSAPSGDEIVWLHQFGYAVGNFDQDRIADAMA